MATVRWGSFVARSVYPTAAAAMLPLPLPAVSRDRPVPAAGTARGALLELSLPWETLLLKQCEVIRTLPGFLNCQEAELQFPC